MSDSLVVAGQALPPTPPEIVEKIKSVETLMRPREHLLKVKTEHLLHAGMYARTIRVEALMVFTSVLVKIPTVIVVNGKCYVYAGEQWHTLEGYSVVPASAGRKHVYVTLGPTEITMLFPSTAKTVEEAEQQFTDEAERLLTRRRLGDDLITVTGS